MLLFKEREQKTEVAMDKENKKQLVKIILVVIVGTLLVLLVPYLFQEVFSMNAK